MTIIRQNKILLPGRNVKTNKKWNEDKTEQRQEI